MCIDKKGNAFFQYGLWIGHRKNFSCRSEYFIYGKRFSYTAGKNLKQMQNMTDMFYDC